MKRKIVSIDEALCNGCGLCVSACHEGAIQLVDGKARLISDSYCDGLGDCLPACPVNAIQIVERDAADYDEAAVAARMAAATGHVPAAPAAAPAAPKPPLPCGCPGQMAKSIARKPAAPEAASAEGAPAATPVAQLANWPVQIKLVNIHAPYLQNAALLIAADCTAFAYPDIHRKFMRNKVTLIGCPKLDEGDYAEKLTALLQANDIKSVTVLRMEVPCCGGIATATMRALQASDKMIPWQVVTISTDGAILED
jgi:NAD-dependent dihydropyrimidine dehydrogenase PreA subunit